MELVQEGMTNPQEVRKPLNHHVYKDSYALKIHQILTTERTFQQIEA